MQLLLRPPLQARENSVETTITSTKNEYVKHVRSLHSGKGRSLHSEFLVEGEKCVRELLAFMPERLRSIIVTEGQFADIVQGARKTGTHVYTAAEHVMSALCDCQTPQGIAAVAAIPEYESVREGFIIALDDVQDPANVGAIIRTADAAGAAGVALSAACADAFSPKAVRASMGSIFHLPVFKVPMPEYLASLASKGYHIACSHLKGATEFSLNWMSTCLVIGNESKGISAPVMALATDIIRIPMYGKAESLNAAVAAGILIYKIRT